MMRLQSFFAVLFTACAFSVHANLPQPVNAFSHDLTSRFFDATHENICISGASIHHALGMAFMGTGEGSKTRQEMSDVLRYEKNVELNSLASHYATMIDQLKVSNESNVGEPPAIAMANRVVLFNGVEVKSSFSDLTQKMGATAQEFKKDTPVNEVLAAINGWVSEQTHQKIPTILSKLDKTDFMALVNAVHFKGQWSKPFSKDGTHDSDFTLLNNGQKKVAMMSKMGSYRYIDGDDAEILELPYAGAHTNQNLPRFSMFIVLPAHDQDFATVLRTFDSTRLGAVANLKSRRGHVSIPKFKVETSINLVDLLKEMGMPSAFEYGDGFSGITTEGELKISQAIHKTFMDVNENGTEAAAATAVVVGMRPTSMQPSEPSTFEFIADRPFLFFIRDNAQKLVLFEGAIVNP